MVRHIVIWQLKDFAEGNNRETNAVIIKEKLEALQGRIPGLLGIQVGIDFSRTGNSGDIVLYSEFADREALDVYQENPEHLALKPFIGLVTSERRLVDYEAA